MRAILLLQAIEYQGQNIPPDMVKVVSVDTDGVLQLATFARLLYRKWAEDVLAYSQSRGTLTAMVDVDLTGKGLSHCVPVAITTEESMVLERIVGLVINNTNQIPKDGKISKEMRRVTSRILETAIQEVEAQKEQLINRENTIMSTTTPDALRYSERAGIYQSGVPGALQCPNCSSPTNLGQRFCGSCGYRLI